MNNLAQRLAAIEEVSQYARSNGALDHEITYAKNELRKEAVLECLREDAKAECEYHDAVRAIENMLADAERGLTAKKLLKRIRASRGACDKGTFVSALDCVLIVNNGVSAITLDGVETFLRTDTEFFRESIELVEPESEASYAVYRTKDKR